MAAALPRRVECALARSFESGAIDAAGLEARIGAIGPTEFEEARAVLRHDGLLLPPESDATAYAAFASRFLELSAFEPALRSSVFPAIESPAAVEAVLVRDIDSRAILAATRPSGAPDPCPAVVPDGGFERLVGSDSGESRMRVRGGDRDGSRRVSDRARRAAERGNHVRAAILWTRSARRAGPEAGLRERASARAALKQLAVRLRKALFVQKGESSLWVGALAPLLENAAAGFWSPERRLLHDLQNVCLDHEREVFRLEPIGWLFSLGRRPLKHPLPHLREVNMSKHLRSAAQSAAPGPPGARSASPA